MVSETILKCQQLIEACGGKDSVLYGYNTDSLYITNTDMKFKDKKDVTFKTNEVDKAYITDSVLTYFERYHRDSMDKNDYEKHKW